MIDCKVKTWSCVEYPVLKPVCSSPMILCASVNSDNLSFKAEVNSLPKLLRCAAALLLCTKFDPNTEVDETLASLN